MPSIFCCIYCRKELLHLLQACWYNEMILQGEEEKKKEKKN